MKKKWAFLSTILVITLFTIQLNSQSIRIKQITNFIDASQSIVITPTYDNSGKLILLTTDYSNTAEDDKTEFTYTGHDPDYYISQYYSVNNQKWMDLEKGYYSYNSNGQVIYIYTAQPSLWGGWQNWQWDSLTYDNLNRISSVRNLFETTVYAINNFNYDSQGRLSYIETDPQNPTTSRNKTQFTYDVNGNCIRRSESWYKTSISWWEELTRYDFAYNSDGTVKSIITEDIRENKTYKSDYVYKNGNIDSIYAYMKINNVWTPTKLVSKLPQQLHPSSYMKGFDYYRFFTIKGVKTKIEYENVTDIKDENIPVSFSLSQNYPNPFNPSTVINFAVPSSGIVSLKVYDVLGNEITSLVNEYKPAGNYSVQFNATGLTSGVYFYKLNTNSYSSVRKMVLIK